MKLIYPATQWGKRAAERLPARHDHALVLATRAQTSLGLADKASQPARLEHQFYARKQLRRALRALT